MANICCTAFESIAHVDFGGFGYLNIALSLRNKGHNVFWLIGRSNESSTLNYDKVLQTLNQHNFSVFSLDDIYLSSNCSDGAYPVDSILKVKSFFVENQVNCVLVDRICTVAQLAAFYSGIKWVGIGTCGREWQFTSSMFHDRLILSPHKATKNILDHSASFADCNNKSSLFEFGYWVGSPYLNISFMPFNFFKGSGGAQCLFVPTFLPPSDGKYILITFGNSMPKPLQYKILELLGELLCELKGEEFILLTGNNDKVFDDANILLAKHVNIKIKKWMDYDLAFKSAKLSIGHGGTAHVWYSIAYQVPLITLPVIADQIYNSTRVKKLGLGAGLYDYHGKRKLLPNCFNMLSHLSSKSLLNSISDVLGGQQGKFNKLASSRDVSFVTAVDAIDDLVG